MRVLLSIVAAAVAVFTGYMWTDTHKKQQEAARFQAEEKLAQEQNRRKDEELRRQSQAREAAERQRAAAEANERQAKQQAVNQLKAASMRDAAAIESILKRFGDEHAIAQSTSRIALGPRVASMQALRREMEALKASPCIAIGHVLAVDAMNQVIRGYLAFMERSPESVAAGHFAAGTKSINQYRSMRDSCLRD